MADNGWIKLSRSFINWEWFDEPNMVWLFVKCLMMANWEDKKWHGISVPRGSFITSYANLSCKKAKVSVQMIRTALERLKSTGEITIKTNNQYTMVSINNYSKYQDINTQDNKQITHEQQTDNKQITTTKEYKEYKELKNIYSNTDSINSEDLLKEVCLKFKVSETTAINQRDSFLDWCSAKGKSFKNYKSAYMNWMRKAIEYKPDLIMKQHNQYVPDLPDISEEQRIINLQRIKDIKSRIMEAN